MTKRDNPIRALNVCLPDTKLLEVRLRFDSDLGGWVMDLHPAAWLTLLDVNTRADLLENAYQVVNDYATSALKAEAEHEAAKPKPRVIQFPDRDDKEPDPAE